MTERRFTNGSGPQGLEECGNDLQKLREFCQDCPREQLDRAHAAIHEEFEPMRAVVRGEIDRRELASAEQYANVRHLERNFSTKFTYKLSILLVVIAVIALGMAAIYYAGGR